jgi:hypothetical protein
MASSVAGLTDCLIQNGMFSLEAIFPERVEVSVSYEAVLERLPSHRRNPFVSGHVEFIMPPPEIRAGACPLQHLAVVPGHPFRRLLLHILLVPLQLGG